MPKLLNINSHAFVDSAWTAVATLVSLLLARALKFPEYYWAPISTIIIMQSSIQPFQGAWQRFVGTALGATLGAAIASYVGRGAIVYAVGIFVCGILAAFSRVWSAYRVSAITFSIVVRLRNSCGIFPRVERLSGFCDYLQHCGVDIARAGVGFRLASLS
jgi:uncharacterized membrane protein YgaE (UPF0421/DUF939 family)